MNRHLLPSFVVTAALASGCGGAPKEPDTTPIPANPPGPDGEPGIGDGAGPPPGEELPVGDEEDGENMDAADPPPPEMR